MKNILRRAKKKEEGANENNVENNEQNIVENNINNINNENSNINKLNEIKGSNENSNSNKLNENNFNSNNTPENQPIIQNLNDNILNINNQVQNDLIINKIEDKKIEDLKVLPPVKEENKIQKEFKNIFQGKDYFSNNTYRKRLMHLTFVCMIVDIIILQILCLFLNVCYGEQIEMQYWVSNSIAPLCVILLFLYIILYFSSDLISRPIIKITSILISILLIFFLAIGIFTLGFAASTTLEDLKSQWDVLSKQSKLFYYDNDINVLGSTYNTKMMLTGILYLVLAILSIVIVCFAYQYLEKLTNDWRPPLRARLSDNRAQRYIDLYTKLNKDYKKLFEMENVAIKNENEKEELLKENKVENILDDVNLNNPLNIKNLEQENNINNEFIIEDKDQQNQKQEVELRKRKSINLRRKKDVNKETEVDENTKLQN